MTAPRRILAAAIARASAAAATAALVLCGCGGKPAGEGEDEAKAPAPVTCAAARAGSIHERVTLRGLLAAPPDRDAQVSSIIAGRILSLRVHEGETVKKGQLLAEIDDPTLAGAVAEGDAGVAAAKAALDNANSAAARARRLFDQGIAAKKDVEEAEARAAGAAGELRAAQARREVAAARQNRALITAPIAGVVVHVFRKTGEVVDGTPATPIAQVADPSHLELVVDAPAKDLVKIGAKQTAELRFDALPGQPVPGEVSLIAPSVDPTTSLGAVRIRALPPPELDGRLRIGLAGVAELDLGERQAHALIPAAAVRRGPTGRDEVVVCAPGATAGEPPHADVREVTTGTHSGDDVEIRDGVAPGERVIVDHVLGIEHGAALAPAPEAPARPPREPGK